MLSLEDDVELLQSVYCNDHEVIINELTDLLTELLITIPLHSNHHHHQFILQSIIHITKQYPADLPIVRVNILSSNNNTGGAGAAESLTQHSSDTIHQ